MLMDLEKLSVWCSLWRRDDAFSSFDSDPVESVPAPAMAQGSRIWERGGLRAGPPAPAQGWRAARSSSPVLLCRLGSWEELSEGLV